MRDEPSKQSDNARARIDRQDAYRKAKALQNKIGDRRATDRELEKLEELRRIINS